MAEKFIIETSARHVHVTQEHLETLFGKGAQLHYRKELSQPGQYACEERVDVVGPKGKFANVSILGPCRGATQIEISLTDARSIGASVPVRESGEIKASAPCKLIGPAGEVELAEGLIAAKRHIHIDPAFAEKEGVKEKEIVKVKLDAGNGRSLIFDDVVIRINPDFRPAMHIDTDESNAAGCAGEVMGVIVK